VPLPRPSPAAHDSLLSAELRELDAASFRTLTADIPAQLVILFDIGHQAYVHKVLTGRWDRFHPLR
jgi:deoxyxylulose-5-phosphate synthase